jgi:hypothetical protein
MDCLTKAVVGTFNCYVNHLPDQEKKTPKTESADEFGFETVSR